MVPEIVPATILGYAETIHPNPGNLMSNTREIEAKLAAAIAAGSAIKQEDGEEFSAFLKRINLAEEAKHAIEGELAAARGEEYAEPLDFPFRMYPVHAEPGIYADGASAYFILYDLTENDPDSPLQDGIVIFRQYVSFRLGYPHMGVIEGHPLIGKGLSYYTAQVIGNSRWLRELESIDRANGSYAPDKWADVNHYVFWLHDRTFECAAREFELKLLDREAARAYIARQL